MSLKSGLLREIKNCYPRMYSVEQVEGYAKLNGYRVSNAERRLRELCEGETPLIRSVKNHKDCIVGYVYQSENELKPVERMRDERIERQKPLFEMRIRG